MSWTLLSLPLARACRRRGRRWTAAAAQARRRRVGDGEGNGRRRRLEASRLDSSSEEGADDEVERVVVVDLLGAALIAGGEHGHARLGLGFAHGEGQREDGAI